MMEEGNNKVIHPNEDRPILKDGYEKFMNKLYYKFAPYMIKHKTDKPMISKGMKVAFVCYGNICRSPFAELYAIKNYKDFGFSSFGFIEENDRVAPENAIIAANKWGIDLSMHKSKCLSEKDINKLDIILIMDRKNYLMYKNSYNRYLSKLYYLDAEKDIDDPFQSSVANFENTYRIIADNIDRIFKN